MQLASTYSDNHLKKFVVRNRFYRLVTNKEVESKNSNNLEEFKSSKNKELLIEALICRSAWIQQNA